MFPRTFGPLSGYFRRSALRRIIRAAAPDLIHVHAGFTSLSAVLLRELSLSFPTVGQFHDIGGFCYLGTRRFMSRDELCCRRVGIGCWRTGCYRPGDPAAMLRGAAQSLVKNDLLAKWRRLPLVVLPSSYLRDVAALQGFRPERLRVVPNSCRPQPLGSPPTEPPLILFVGALLRTKGIHLFLDALALVADLPWRSVVAGAGPEKARLEQQIVDLGLTGKVSLIGPQDRPSLDKLYSECRMLVHTSTIPESFGLVGIEAMAYAKPVVGFELGGVTEWLVNGETGLAVTPWSPTALADGIRKLLQNPVLASQLGLSAQARTRDRFAPERYLDRILTVYAEAVQIWRGTRSL